MVGGIQRLEDRRAIDYREDFFGKAAFLTVCLPARRASTTAQEGASVGRHMDIVAEACRVYLVFCGFYCSLALLH